MFVSKHNLFSSIQLCALQQIKFPSYIFIRCDQFIQRNCFILRQLIIYLQQQLFMNMLSIGIGLYNSPFSSNKISSIGNTVAFNISNSAFRSSFSAAKSSTSFISAAHSSPST
eukprot:Mycagemm_TRINITY_DN10302_c2_g8::TRINITY_DN10302_c2_g8_i2::g.1383::m.1383 type:complete len:113 gc:universal TRINITY_DN10302_c2_g8_i2:961-623(-)